MTEKKNVSSPANNSQRQTEALQALNDISARILNGIDAFVFVVDLKTYEIIFINTYGKNICGDVMGKICWQVFHAGMNGPCEHCPKGKLIGQDGSLTEGVIRESQITVNNRWYNFLGKVMYWPDDRIVRLGIATDITRCKQMKIELENACWRLECIIEGSHAGTWEWNIQSGETLLNETWAEFIGYTLDELSPTSIHTWEALTHPDDLKRSTELLERHFAGEIPYYDCECRMKHKDGHWVWVQDRGRVITRTDDGKPLMMFGSHTDITQRRNAEAEMAEIEARNRQLLKDESLHRMAGAVAHNFNNQLHVVIGNLEMAMDELLPDSGVSETLGQALKAARKAATVSAMMRIYRGQIQGKQMEMDLSEACRLGFELLQAAAPKNVVLKTDYPASGPVILANSDQIQQVLASLVTNAWEASGENQAAITLSVKAVVSADIPASKRFPVNWQPREGVYACLEVADTGRGIAEKDIDKIFDPFFTTNFCGRGMGLSVAIGIAGAHGGRITVESQAGRGSVFRLFLPVLPEDGLTACKKVEKAPEIKGSDTVLVVDDEEQLRDVVKKMLNRLGFAVLEAGNGMDAVEVFRRHRDEIRCVITDLTMPYMNGWDTLAALRKLSRDIPVILSSGYNEAQVMAEEHAEIPNVFLEKPYRLQELKDAVRKSLADTNT